MRGTMVVVSLLLAGSLEAIAQTPGVPGEPQGDTRVRFRLYTNNVAECPPGAEMQHPRSAPLRCIIRASQCPPDRVLIPRENGAPFWVCVRRGGQE
jgi:hypothetical protein